MADSVNLKNKGLPPQIMYSVPRFKEGDEITILHPQYKKYRAIIRKVEIWNAHYKDESKGKNYYYSVEGCPYALYENHVLPFKESKLLKVLYFEV